MRSARWCCRAAARWAYQAGVYQGLAEGGIHPNWIAGISIGALNAAVIAGNPPETRVAQLRAFWEYICAQPWLPGLPLDLLSEAAPMWPEPMRSGSMASTPRVRWRASAASRRAHRRPVGALRRPRRASYYDTAPLKSTLERFADFDRINRPKEMRVSVGAVNVRTGNFAYFDNTRMTLRAEHFMASGALPPGFPASRSTASITGMAGWYRTRRCRGADRPAAARCADFPGGPVERPWQAAAQPAGRGRAPERHPVLQPHARHHRLHARAAELSPHA
jgi:hypothetical protein